MVNIISMREKHLLNISLKLKELQLRKCFVN